MILTDFLKEAVLQKTADIFIIAGKELCCSVNGSFIKTGDKLSPEQTQTLLTEIYSLANRDMAILEDKWDDDFSFSLERVARFRVNAFRQRGSVGATLRVVNFALPSPEDLRIPDQVIDLYQKKKGMVLITGPTGSGKSTTLACIIHKINSGREAHIVTLEDPIEYLHRHEKSIVTQREIAMDTENYAVGLRSALREAANVILLGEMRDLETISTAMSAAETGQLILSSLHTIGASNTIDRIIDVFPSTQQHQIRIQLAMVLQAVVSQQLIPSKTGGLVPAFEIMFCNNAIRNLIREAKMHQIDSVIYSGANQHMITMDASILDLYNQGLITEEDAILHSVNQEWIKKKIGG